MSIELGCWMRYVENSMNKVVQVYELTADNAEKVSKLTGLKVSRPEVDEYPDLIVYQNSNQGQKFFYPGQIILREKGTGGRDIYWAINQNDRNHLKPVHL